MLQAQDTLQIEAIRTNLNTNPQQVIQDLKNQLTKNPEFDFNTAALGYPSLISVCAELDKTGTVLKFILDHMREKNIALSQENIRELLCKAVVNKNLNTLNLLIDSKTPLASYKHDAKKLEEILFTAVENGYSGIVAFCFEQLSQTENFDFNAFLQSEKTQNIFLLAAQQGNLAIINTAMEYQVPYQLSIALNSPLKTALKNHHFDIAQCLLSYSTNKELFFYLNTLTWAICPTENAKQAQQTALVAYLLKTIKQDSSFSQKPYVPSAVDTYNVIHSKNISLMKLFLSYGVEPNQKITVSSNKRYLPLEIAQRTKDQRMIDFLRSVTQFPLVTKQNSFNTRLWTTVVTVMFGICFAVWLPPVISVPLMLVSIGVRAVIESLINKGIIARRNKIITADNNQAQEKLKTIREERKEPPVLSLSSTAVISNSSSPTPGSAAEPEPSSQIFPAQPLTPGL